jgi:predicted TIM-barrel fold metal-dependent hydrolase
MQKTMDVKVLAAVLLPILAACASAPAGDQGAERAAPFVDYHQHLVSAPFEPLVKLPQRDAAALVRELDEAGIEKAVVLSVGYSFADERKKLPDPDRLTREENDWTSAQVSRYPTRLIGFCSANYLRDAALQEIERCLRLPGMTGIKIHVGNNGISFRDNAHLQRLQGVFALAQKQRSPILIHMRPRGGANYGGGDVQTFLDRVVSVAPNVEVVVAHLGTSGPGYGEQTDEIMAAFGAAAQRNDARLRNVYFEVASNVTEETTTEEAALIASRLRAVGIDRILYGSDLSASGGSIRSGWEIFKGKVPLTPEELQRIAKHRTRFVINAR